MKNDSTDKSARMVQSRLLKKIKELNADKSSQKYSLDPDDYEFDALQEEKYSIYTCKFVEKKTRRTIFIEIKSFE